MKNAFINGIILDGSEKMIPQEGKIIFTDGSKIEKITDSSLGGAFDLFSKTRSSISIWKTFYDGGEKIQIPVHPADPSYINYKEAWKEEFESTKNDWNATNVNMWKKFHCKYFSCCTIEVNGITENEEIRELLNVVRNVL